jgi:hypothetical protein
VFEGVIDFSLGDGEISTEIKDRADGERSLIDESSFKRGNSDNERDGV